MLYERINKTQSPLECRFLEDCATVGLLVDPQHKVDVIHADFVIRGTNVVIECDSREYHSGDAAEQNDAIRNEIYFKHGYAVIRIAGSQIFKGGERIAQEIKDWLHNERFIPGYVYYPTSKDSVVSMIESRGGFEGISDDELEYWANYKPKK